MLIVVLFALLSSGLGFAAADSYVHLDSFSADLSNRDRIIQGGKNFQQTCLSCHSLNAFMNDSVAKELGLSKDQMPVWPPESWNGHPPPDLSLIALSMSPEWLYTYLRTYYVDAERPTGYNNLVFPNTNMPNPFVDAQGSQVLIDPNYFDKQHHASHDYWYRVIKLKQGGRMSAEEFDDYVADIVTFLTYVSDPSIFERRQMGAWVLGYLVLFIAVTFAYFKVMGKYYFKAPKRYH